MNAREGGVGTGGMRQCKKRARGHRGRDVLTDWASARGRDVSAQGKDVSAQGKNTSAHNLQLNNHSKGHKMEEPCMTK
jgi:hypothetical protein